MHNECYFEIFIIVNADKNIDKIIILKIKTHENFNFDINH